MQESSVAWSLPWQALQRSLAQGGAFEVVHQPPPARGCTISWLARALRREHPRVLMNP